MTRFHGICLITKDVIKLREFYTAILRTEADGDEVFSSTATTNAQLSIFSQDGMESMAPGSLVGAGTGGFTLEFEVQDVDAEYGRLQQQGVTFVKMPTTQPWGRRSVWFRDPDGNIINFYANVSQGK